MIPSTLRGSKIIIALTRNNRCTNFNRRLKKVKFQGVLFGLLLPNILWFLYFLSSLQRFFVLSPGQTDRQVDASGRKLNLGGQTDRQVSSRHKCTRVAKNPPQT